MTPAEEAYEKAKELILQSIADQNDFLDLSRAGRTLEEIPTEIEKATHVTRLDLRGTQITDLTPIAGMTGITELYLSGTQVSDLTPIAGRTGITWLNLSDTQVADLTPIAGLTEITHLILNGTQVSDLTPIASMTGVENLYLRNTPVRDISMLPRDRTFEWLDLSDTEVLDLRPLADLPVPSHIDTAHLKVTNTPAAKADPRIAEIDAMEYDEERVKTLQAYLKDWVPPGENSVEPEDTDFLPSTIENGRLEIALLHPSEAERDEDLKRILHQRLISDISELAEAAQNYHPKTFQKAKKLSGRLKVPFEELDMVNIHLDIEALGHLRTSGRESDLAEPFAENVLEAFEGVLASGPGLTLDNPEVEKLIARINKFRNAPQPEDAQEKHNALSEATANDKDAAGPNLREIQKQALEAETDAERQAIQDGVNRGILIRLGRWALAGSIAGASAVLTASAIDVAKAPIVAYVQANLPVLMDVAALYGAQFKIWFGTALAEVKEFAGPLAAIDFRTVDRNSKNEEEQ